MLLGFGFLLLTAFVVAEPSVFKQVLAFSKVQLGIRSRRLSARLLPLSGERCSLPCPYPFAL